MISEFPNSFIANNEKLTSRLDDIFTQLTGDRLVSPALGGSLSFKTSLTDAFMREVDALLVCIAGAPGRIIARLAPLIEMASLSGFSQQERQFIFGNSRLHEQSGLPDETSLLHASLPARSVALFTHPSFLVLSCTRDWKQSVELSLGSNVLSIELSDLDAGRYHAIANNAVDPGLRGIYLRYHGLLVWAEELEDLAQIGRTLLSQVMESGFSVLPVPMDNLPYSPPQRTLIAQRRLQISGEKGSPFLLRLAGALPAGNQLDDAGVPTAAHWRAPVQPVFDRVLGILLLARDAREFELQFQLLASNLEIQATASRIGILELLPIQRIESRAKETGLFSGEAALVTGAATGIGRAAVQSLLDRGAAVVGLDIKPAITSLFDSPSYLGLAVDLTDETAVLNCLEQAVRHFGGLDMLVLNAGIFPRSCSLDQLTMEHWRKVMSINLDVNVTLLREAYPLLRNAPRKGRVVINSSRNVPAPGPGAAAYSASKAALTQIGRVAALEWAQDGIRVNILNPHAVFDTGIWTDEVIASRAAKYGLTVDQYKTNNLLRVELTSRDVGEMIAAALGPLFSKTTGAQIPIDGGSDRVV